MKPASPEWTPSPKFNHSSARRKLAHWRYDYNNVRPHSSLGNQTPAEAHRALEQFEGSAYDALAQTETNEYEIQTRKLSL
jgi:putative transposase